MWFVSNRRSSYTIATASVIAPTTSDIHGKDDHIGWKLKAALFIFALVVSCAVHMICIVIVVVHCKEAWMVR